MFVFYNCSGACSVVEEVMLQEAFDLPSTQILSLYALGSYLATRPQLAVSESAALKVFRTANDSRIFLWLEIAKSISCDSKRGILGGFILNFLYIFVKRDARCLLACCSRSTKTLVLCCDQVSEERALGASLLICGQKQDNTIGLSAQLLGNAFLGKCLSFFSCIFLSYIFCCDW